MRNEGKYYEKGETRGRGKRWVSGYAFEVLPLER